MKLYPPEKRYYKKACVKKGLDRRPSREGIHMATAVAWSKRSLCKRLQVGAVITTPDMRQILSVGYNGPAMGLPHNRCREKEVGNCGCLHAEDNAIVKVDGSIPNKIMFVTESPCEMCAQRIIQANIVEVIYLGKYRTELGMEILKCCEIKIGYILDSEDL